MAKKKKIKNRNDNEMLGAQLSVVWNDFGGRIFSFVELKSITTPMTDSSQSVSLNPEILSVIQIFYITKK